MARPSVRQLEYLVAVADELGFHRAAEACFVTQPALSTQVREVESLLGVRLFERSRRQVVVTPAGEAVVGRARAVLADLDELVAEARGFRRPLCGPLRLGVIPTIAPYLLPRVLPPIRRRYPELRLLLREEQTERLVELARTGKLDLLLLAIEADLGDLETVEVFRDPFLLALPKGHRLAARKWVREADLAGEEVLLLEDGHCLRHQALALCNRAGASELGDFRASSLTTLAEMVASGIGVTLLPELAVGSQRKSRPDVEIRSFRAPPPYRTIGLAWRRTSPRKEEFRLLRDVIREAS